MKKGLKALLIVVAALFLILPLFGCGGGGGGGDNSTPQASNDPGTNNPPPSDNPPSDQPPANQPPADNPPPSPTAPADMTAARSSHSAMLLPSGLVLIAGGWDSGSLKSMELYDPSTKIFTPINDMPVKYTRTFVAVLLKSGQILFAGIESTNNTSSSTPRADLYDPTNKTFAPTSVLIGRKIQTATLLPDGRVLLAGGLNDAQTVAFSSAELYDPNLGTSRFTGAMSTARYNCTATLLNNGKVLVVGGISDPRSPFTYLNSAEIYDPQTEVFTPVGLMTTGRQSHTATLLPSGKVLIMGGSGLNSAEIFDPTTNSFSPTVATQEVRLFHQAVLLKDGTVLITGGIGSPPNSSGRGMTSLASVELYDPNTNEFQALPAMKSNRAYHQLTLLPSGKALATGGYNYQVGRSLKTVELFE